MKRLSDWGYTRRDPISWGLAAFLAACLLLATQTMSFRVIKLDNNLPMALTLELPAFQPSTPQVQARTIEKISTPRAEPLHRSEPAQIQASDTSEAPTAALQEPKAVDGMTSAKAESVVSRPNATEVPKTPIAETRKPSSSNAVYLSELVAYLEKIKRYPSSREARLTRPQGTVTVWLELDRQGVLRGAGVVESSGSNLLDGEALRTVKSGVYPSMSEDTFAQEASHRFQVHLKYELK